MGIWRTMFPQCQTLDCSLITFTDLRLIMANKNSVMCVLFTLTMAYQVI